jgi:hypothetical protein
MSLELQHRWLSNIMTGEFGWVAQLQAGPLSAFRLSHLSSTGLVDDNNSHIRQHMFNLLTLKMEIVCTSETTATQLTSTGFKDPREDSVSAMNLFGHTESVNIFFLQG